jgi:hypothetical protein
MVAEKAWGIGMKRACESRQGGGGAEGEVLAWWLKARRKLVKKRPASTWKTLTMRAFSWVRPGFVALNQPPIRCSFMFGAICSFYFSRIMIVKCHFFFVL